MICLMISGEYYFLTTSIFEIVCLLKFGSIFVDSYSSELKNCLTHTILLEKIYILLVKRIVVRDQVIIE